MLQKSTSQQIQLQLQSPITNPLPPQPLPNPKGFLNAIRDEKDEEELPAKCEDPDLGPLKKSKEVFSTADTSIMSIAGIADNVLVTIGKLTILADFHILKPTPKEKKGKPQVLLGRPFLKTGGFEQDYHNDTFKFSAGKTTEKFQIDKKEKDHSLRKDDGRMRGKESAHIEMIEAMAR
ncbi:hypothetical protein PIB30_039848 [Stylosanthes scabra]|uniref:Reverse transcriptase domain-containing protein n=1 Tax=Stylosanthes scabra TaxID=79078 RepID=A0ABU6UFP5_9FABA|nr:hypothetical protein [Stylosanthes scabra]